MGYCYVFFQKMQCFSQKFTIELVSFFILALGGAKKILDVFLARALLDGVGGIRFRLGVGGLDFSHHFTLVSVVIWNQIGPPMYK